MSEDKNINLTESFHRLEQDAGARVIKLTRELILKDYGTLPESMNVDTFLKYFESAEDSIYQLNAKDAELDLDVTFKSFPLF